MATCLDIITLALKLGKIISSGETPGSDESTDGMTCLQSMYDQMVVGGMFGRLEDIYLTEDETALEGKRYFVPTGLTLTPATSVYVDVDGTTRQPRDLALYESVTEAGARSVKLYDRTAWVELTGLALTSDAPLALRSETGLAAALACSDAFLAMFGDADVSLRVERLGNRFLGSIAGKMGSTQDVVGPDYF